MPEEKECFIICPIGEEGSDTRKRADQVLKHIFEPVAKKCGYGQVIRADKISQPGIITRQVIEKIRDAPMVIADLTDSNANVFYELALRHALKKPLVQLIQKEQDISFDISATRVIRFDYKDLDSVEETKLELEKHIKAAEKDPTAVDNPISMTFDLEALKSSTDPQQRNLGEILSEVRELKAIVSDLSRSLSTARRGFLSPEDLARFRTVEAAKRLLREYEE